MPLGACNCLLQHNIGAVNSASKSLYCTVLDSLGNKLYLYSLLMYYYSKEEEGELNDERGSTVCYQRVAMGHCYANVIIVTWVFGRGCDGITRSGCRGWMLSLVHICIAVVDICNYVHVCIGVHMHADW